MLDAYTQKKESLRTKLYAVRYYAERFFDIFIYAAVKNFCNSISTIINISSISHFFPFAHFHC